MEINKPETLTELTAAFEQYQQALDANDPDYLNQFFWKSPQTVRYGVAENLYGYDDIGSYRRNRAKVGGAPERKVSRSVITTFGRDFGTTNIDFVRTKTGTRGRQSQVWMRTSEGWRIVSAHVSLIRDAD